MNRWSAGGIALSSVPSRYQHGSVFHARGPDGAPANAAERYIHVTERDAREKVAAAFGSNVRDLRPVSEAGTGA